MFEHACGIGLKGVVSKVRDLWVSRPDLLNPINLIPPVQSHFQKYFRSHLTQIKSISLAVLSPKGRIAIVTDAGWDAVDAAASARDVMAGQAGSACERSNGEQTNGACADGKAVWSWHPLLVSSWRRHVGPTGRGQAVNPLMTVTRRIRRRGEHGISRKTIA
jgi:hypothetical protein